ncbi:MAG: sulfurtransferase [Gemmatimonadaceae bacterium]|nr:sulfurtransferase [Gemmatimonadaceae bacterium]
MSQRSCNNPQAARIVRAPSRLLAALGALMAVVACSDDPVSPPTAAVQPDLLVSDAWLASRLNDPLVIVLHVGTDATYRAAHVPGARLVLSSALAVERNGLPSELPDVATLDALFETAGVSDASHVVLTGDGPVGAARGFFTLDYLGQRRVSMLDGGLAGWRAAGRPTETTSPTVARSAFTPRVQPARLVDADWVSARLGRPGVALVDVRPTAEYTGEIPGNALVQRPGHIPGARNVFWRTFQVSDTDQRLKPEAALRALLEGAGAAPGVEVVTYCAIGALSSFGYFVARYMGYEVKLYDGSFVDWSQRTQLPVNRGPTP